MNFQDPKHLFYLALVLLGYGFIRWLDRKKDDKFKRWIDQSLWRSVVPRYQPQVKKVRLYFFTLSLVFLVLAWARPQWGHEKTVLEFEGKDVLFLLDVSNSMEAEDVIPNRLSLAKIVMKSYLDQAWGDRVGVIAFAGSAYVAVPLSIDLQYVREQIDWLSPKSVQNQGTNFSNALKTALQSLEKGSESKKEGNQSLVLLTDGENHEEEANSLVSKLRENGSTLYVMGVGTEKGAPIPIRDENGVLRSYKHYPGTQDAVVSKLNVKNLKALADLGGGRYWTVQDAGNVLQELRQALLKTSTDQKVESQEAWVPKERFQIFVFLSILFLLLEMTYPFRWENKKASVVLFLFLGLGWALVPQAKAESLQGYYYNEKALRSFEEKDFENAKKFLENAKDKDPDQAELDYNLGVVQFFEKKFPEAQRSFERSISKMNEKSSKDLYGKSLFGIANSKALQNQWKEALQNYSQVIEEARKNQDAELEHDARQNLELMLSQKSNSSQNESGDQQDQSDDQKGKSNSENQDQSQGGNEKKQKGKQYKSQNLKKEDAERILNDLQEREKELQKKLKNKGKPYQGGVDW